MSTTWLVVAGVGAATIALKGAGTLALGSRALPATAEAVIALVAPSLLAALVVVQTLGDERAVVVDARLAGVAVAALALVLRAGLPVVLATAAAVAAATRARRGVAGHSRAARKQAILRVEPGRCARRRQAAALARAQASPLRRLRRLLGTTSSSVTC